MNDEFEDLKNAIHAKRGPGRIATIRRCLLRYELALDALFDEKEENAERPISYILIGAASVAIVWIAIAFLP